MRNLNCWHTHNWRLQLQYNYMYIIQLPIPDKRSHTTFIYIIRRSTLSHKRILMATISTGWQSTSRAHLKSLLTNVEHCTHHCYIVTSKTQIKFTLLNRSSLYSGRLWLIASTVNMCTAARCVNIHHFTTSNKTATSVVTEMRVPNQSTQLCVTTHLVYTPDVYSLNKHYWSLYWTT